MSNGIDGDTLPWIKTFLEDLLQIVMVKRIASYHAPVMSGIPQGSVLGPLLFLIFINDMSVVIRSEMYHFTDDTKIFNQIKLKKTN